MQSQLEIVLDKDTSYTMFAVPGWSVSADKLKTQTRILNKTAEKNLKADTNGSTANVNKPSKKRKRGAHSNGTTVNGDNLARLWEEHIEGKLGGKDSAEAVAKREQRKRKKESREAQVGTAGDITTDGSTKSGIGKADGKEEYQKRKTLKEKRREKKALPQANGDFPPPRPANIAKYAPLDATLTKKHPINPSKDPLPSPSATAKTPSQPSILTPLQSSMRQKLISARFRHLNQTLYTTPSSSSYDLFSQNPTFFSEYHEGFQRQVNAWPENPVDRFIIWIKERGSVKTGGKALGTQKSLFRKDKNGAKSTPALPELPSDPSIIPLPRHHATHTCTIADLGCGTALLSRTLTPLSKSLNLHIHSYDLCASSPLITIADICALPLKDASIDIAIFCLAVMGTNWIDFVEEAWRVLRWKGECWIAEVGSRFASPTGMKKAGRVAHSIGNRTKPGATKKKGKKERDEDADDEDAIFDAEPDSTAPSQAAPGQTTTDLAPFISVLRTRGFLLSGEPELGNKMFVRMRFVKGLTPMRGKNVPAQSATAVDYKGTKFVEKEKKGDGEVGTEEETKVLKACVYKNR